MDCRGIIPARAGFTNAVHASDVGQRDHPRSRGVYSRCVEAVWIAAGSSPLARGLREDRDLQVLGEGIIPARAGFTPKPTRQPT